MSSAGVISLFPFLQRKSAASALVGLSLGADGIALARVQWQGEAGPVVQECDFRQLAGVDEAPASLVELVQAHHLQGAMASLVLSSGEFNLLTVDTPAVDASEMQEAVKWKVKDMISYPIEDAVVDVFDVPGQQDRGRTPMIYAVVARREILKARIDMIRESGLDLQSIDIPELTQRNITSLLEEDDRGVAFLHLSGQGGLITLTRQGVLYLAREIEIGLQHLQPRKIAVAAVGDLSVSMPPSEEHSLDDVVLEVQRSLDYYESHFNQAPIRSLVIAPLQQPVEGIVEHMREALGLTVRQLDLNEVPGTAETVSTEMQARCLPALGAALRRESAGA